MSNQKLSTAELKKLNRSTLFQVIYQANHSVTKQELATKTGLSLPTVTQNLKELFALGLLRYDGTEESTGGRKPRLMTIEETAKFSVGMELSPKHIRLTAIDLKGEEMLSAKVPFPFDQSEEYRKVYCKLLEDFLDDFHLKRERLLGVGITLPAIVHTETDRIETSPVLKLHDAPISELVKEIPYPTFVQNDASAGAVAEWHKNPALRETGAVAYLFLGKGVGGALLFHGTPYEGKHNRSGEFGHMTIVENGRLCACGKKGCMEAYCSTTRLTDDLSLDMEEFFSFLSLKKEGFEAIWQDYLTHLAKGIALIHTALDCDIIIGGALSPYLEPYAEQLWMLVRQYSTFPPESSGIVISKCGETANCIGAAYHFIDEFLASV